MLEWTLCAGFRCASASGGQVTKAEKQRLLAFEQWDVFADQPLRGNLLGVFLDAGGLTDGEMQSLAREKFLSETTFILRRSAAV